MSLDAAGNYLFTVGDNQYRVMKMDVFKQRDFIGAMKSSFTYDESGNASIDLYSEGANNAQDYLMQMIAYKNSPESWVFLTPSELTKHLEQSGKNQLNLMNEIFSTVSGGLIENFTGTGEESPRLTSSQTLENESNAADSQGMLAKTLNQ